MAAPTITGSSTVTVDYNSGMTITLPGGIGSGDLIMIFVSNNGASVLTPSGFSALDGTGQVFYTTSGGGDSGAGVNLTWGSKQWAAAIAIVVGTGFLIDHNYNLLSDTSPAAATTYTNNLIIRSFLYNAEGADFTPSAQIPAGTTHAVSEGNFDASDKDAVVVIATEVKAVTGAVAAATWAKSCNHAHTVVIGGPDSVGGGGGGSGGTGSAILLGV